MSLFNKKLVVSPYMIPFINKGKGIGIVGVRGYGKASVRIENNSLILDSYERKDSIQVFLKDIHYLKYHQGNIIFEPKIIIRTDKNEFILSGYDNNDMELEIFYNTLLRGDEEYSQKQPQNTVSQGQIEILPDNINALDLTNYENKKIKNIVVTEDNFNKIDINKVFDDSLQQIHVLNEVNKKKILKLKKMGIVIKSYDDLKEKLNLNDKELDYIKKEIIINDYEEENDTTSTLDVLNDLDIDLNVEHEENNSDSLNQDAEKNNDETINDKIDLNNASLDELSELPGMNIIKAKKILQFRDSGDYIISYDDLGVKLSLNSRQINQIKEVTIISEGDNSQKRVVDL